MLGVSRKKPDYGSLTELVKAQLTRIPFENISKLYFKKLIALRGLIDLERHLDGIERHNLGGTCYANNYYLHLLLRHLGYDVMLCGADMTDPDEHLVNVVTVEGRSYLVDGGYGAPFLTPMPLDLEHDLVIDLGRERYVLNPRSTDGGSRLDLYRDGKLNHGYTVRPVHRDIDHFGRMIGKSFRDEASFMRGLTIIRFEEGRSVVIRNFTLIESEGTKFKTSRLAGREQLLDTLESRFGVPREIAAEAISEIAKVNEEWG